MNDEWGRMEEREGQPRFQSGVVERERVGVEREEWCSLDGECIPHSRRWVLRWDLAVQLGECGRRVWMRCIGCLRGEQVGVCAWTSLIYVHTSYPIPPVIRDACWPRVCRERWKRGESVETLQEGSVWEWCECGESRAQARQSGTRTEGMCCRGTFLLEPAWGEPCVSRVQLGCVLWGERFVGGMRGRERERERERRH